MAEKFPRTGVCHTSWASIAKRQPAWIYGLMPGQPENHEISRHEQCCEFTERDGKPAVAPLYQRWAIERL